MHSLLGSHETNTWNKKLEDDTITKSFTLINKNIERQEENNPNMDIYQSSNEYANISFNLDYCVESTQNDDLNFSVDQKPYKTSIKSSKINELISDNKINETKFSEFFQSTTSPSCKEEASFDNNELLNDSISKSCFLKDLLINEILDNIHSQSGNSAILWMNTQNFSLIPIPWLSNYGIWICWTNKGLSFLLDLSDYISNESQNSKPFLILGIHSNRSKYFKELTSINIKNNIEVHTNSSFNFNSKKNDLNYYKSTLLDLFNKSNFSSSEKINDNLTEDSKNVTSTEVSYSYKTDLDIENNIISNNQILPYSFSNSECQPTQILSKTYINSSKKFKSKIVLKPIISNISSKTKINFGLSSKSNLNYGELKNISFYGSRLKYVANNLLDSWELSISFRKHQLKILNKKKDLDPQNIDSSQSSKLDNSTNDKQFKHGTWEYYNGESTLGEFNNEIGIPVILFDECEVLAGLKKSSSIRCNISLANHRVNAALNGSYTISLCDNNGIYTDKLENNLDKLKNSENYDIYNNKKDIQTPDLIKLNENLIVPEGSMIKVKYPNEYPGYFEEDIVTIYSQETLKKCLNKAVEMCEDGPDLSPMNLGQLSYRLFWCLTIISNGKIELLVEELVPTAASKRFRRKCPWIHEISKSIIEKRLKYEKYKQKVQLNEKLRQQELDLCFEQMRKFIDECTILKRKKRQDLQIEQDSKYGKKYSRHPPLQDCDEKSIIEAVIDESSGIFKRPLSTLTESQKRCIYQECIRKNICAPIHLTRISSKGRGVLAADFIPKEDFVLEYRGELISEKEGRERDIKYDRARTNKGSFMFYFKHNGKNLSIDATDEGASLGPARLINHSMKNPNLIAKTILVDDIARLFFCAKRDIFINEELLVDYGERDPEVIQKHPWLTS